MSRITNACLTLILIAVYFQFGASRSALYRYNYYNRRNFIPDRPPRGYTTDSVSVNNCPDNSPWPCRSGGTCLSFEFICDGRGDCEDNSDEEEVMCTAKNRPATSNVVFFINLYKDWLIPDFLGEMPVNEIAELLVESPTRVVFAEKANLDDGQFKKLNQLLKAVKERKMINAMVTGMPVNAWNTVRRFFERFINTGF